ncbi:unnamed protein product [Rotaria sp. Silwood2]|nr:unnamed protein product [Rotaria sp. Silwood2]
MAIICLLIVIVSALMTNLHGLPIPTNLSRRQRSFDEIGIEDQNIILNAMRTLESLTAVNNVPCVQFREKVDSDGEYFIIIENGIGCSSYVGRHTGLKLNRTVTLQNPGCLRTGTIMHELLHILGFYHEQSRSDRDDYVRIIWENIEPGMEYNFYKADTSDADNLNTPYDFSSIMHYGRKYFSVNGADTLEALNSSIAFGQRVTLSSYDIQAIQTFYGCSEPITISTTTTTTTATKTTTTTTKTTTTITTTETTTTTTTETTTTTTTETTTTTTTQTTTTTVTEITTTTTIETTLETTTTTTTETTTTTTTETTTAKRSNIHTPRTKAFTMKKLRKD